MVRGVWTQWSWAFPYRRDLHLECEVKGNSASIGDLLLALPVPIYSDLKDRTEAIVSGIILGHRLFRKGRHFTSHHSYPPTLDLIKTISVLFH